MKRGFTLIELIVVIIIVGILAALGISQYSKTVEKSRGSEARIALGQMRQLAYQYWLEKGTTAGMSYADLNIGTDSSQLPGAGSGNCRSTHYFYYNIGGAWPDIPIQLRAWRCSGGGKSPQGTSGNYLQLNADFSAGTNTWVSYGGY